jgi:hypothetical protein
LFAADDRIMFLRNERSMGVKNGSLGTIERVDQSRMAVRLDDGRAVAFDHKDYADLNHGYAATIHKSQGVTVDRTHVLATPGLDRHGSYVALSRHRTGLDLHYGKDDFANRDKLAGALSRDRSKDMARDYGNREERFSQGRGIGPAATPTASAPQVRAARQPAPEPATEPPQRRGRFEGLRLRVPSFNPVPVPGRTQGLKLTKPVQAAPQTRDAQIGKAVERYARTVADMDRMSSQNLPALEYTQDLAKIHDRQDVVRENILKLAKRPAMALTPEMIASQISEAGAKARDADHQALNAAQQNLRQAISSIGSGVASAMTARDQERWIVGAAGIAIVVGFILGAVIPTAIDRAMPESWHWPEQRAADALQLDGWHAGLRMLQVSDPGQWRALQDAAILARDNADALADCRKRAAKAKKAVSCSIKVPKPAAQ